MKTKTLVSLIRFILAEEIWASLDAYNQRLKDYMFHLQELHDKDSELYFAILNQCSVSKISDVIFIQVMEIDGKS